MSFVDFFGAHVTVFTIPGYCNIINNNYTFLLLTYPLYLKLYYSLKIKEALFLVSEAPCDE